MLGNFFVSLYKLKIFIMGTAFEQRAIDEALARFNGYWAWDYQMCDNVASKYGYSREAFKSAVYKHLNSK